MSHEPNVRSIFVYGTLKRGGVREHCWPHQPLRIVPSRIRGALYDLGPYPAVDRGDDWVAGERWELACKHLQATLMLLDTVEGYDQDDEHNWYERRVIACTDDDHTKHKAHTYFYARPHELANATRIAANAEGVCSWIP